MWEDKEKEEEKPIVAKTAVDLQRLKLMKLMKNPEKPVILPERPKAKATPSVPEFVRNVMGSSAGAGSGEFHVYRHLRRKEYARQKYIQEKGRKELLDEEYHMKIEQNKKAFEETKAKKRAKRQKRKEKQKQKKRLKTTKTQKQEENICEIEDSSSNEDEIEESNTDVTKPNETISNQETDPKSINSEPVLNTDNNQSNQTSSNVEDIIPNNIKVAKDCESTVKEDIKEGCIGSEQLEIMKKDEITNGESIELNKVGGDNAENDVKPKDQDMT
ncbi:hypothetical protein KM043_015217 [Ampulex compressa]|nr:hypothetical protein KM043_015217 [Ampulex compressa]